MRKSEKPLPAEAPLSFDLEPKPAEEMLTALRALPLVVQAVRSLVGSAESRARSRSVLVLYRRHRAVFSPLRVTRLCACQRAPAQASRHHGDLPTACAVSGFAGEDEG
jgi:hypothetical protein